MRRIDFHYTRCARRADIMELAREMSPLETAGLEPALVDSLPGALLAEAAHCRTYSVRLDGRLAGVCFIRDLPDRREMAFTKTRYLTEERKVTFARGIRQLLQDLADWEAEAGRDRRPMYMHTPDGDDRSRAWFVRSGCVETDDGLLCPSNRKES